VHKLFVGFIRRTACARAQFSGCSSTTKAHSETGQMAVSCQNLPLDALSSRSAHSVLVSELFKKFGLFLNTGVYYREISRIKVVKFPAFMKIVYRHYDHKRHPSPGAPCFFKQYFYTNKLKDSYQPTKRVRNVKIQRS